MAESSAVRRGMEILDGAGGGDFYACRGLVIAMPYGVTVVPYSENDSGWDCVVVASEDERYPVGGWDVDLSHDDLRAGRVIDIEDAGR